MNEVQMIKKAGVITVAIFIIHYLSGIWGIEPMVSEGPTGWVKLFAFYWGGIILTLYLLDKMGVNK